jgi:hypothetical protein
MALYEDDAEYVKLKASLISTAKEVLGPEATVSFRSHWMHARGTDPDTGREIIVAVLPDYSAMKDLRAELRRMKIKKVKG